MTRTHARRLGAIVTGIAAGAVAVLCLGLPAHAVPASAPASAPTAPAPVGESCGLFVETGVTVCVAPGQDLHAAVKAQTGQTIVTSAAPGHGPAIETAAAPAAVATSSLLGRLYDDQNFGGGSLELYGTSGCTASNGFGFADIGSAWYGRISSFQGYSGCQVKIFSGTGYTGSSYGFLPSSSYVGAAMNDATRSVQFHS